MSGSYIWQRKKKRGEMTDAASNQVMFSGGREKDNIIKKNV